MQKDKKPIPYIIIAIILVAVLAIRDGFMILWKHGDPKASKIWHALGLIIRVVFFIVPLIWFWLDWPRMIFWGLVFINFGFTFWNMAINVITKQPLLYLGNTSTIDIFFNKHKWLYYTIIIILFVAPVLWGIFVL